MKESQFERFCPQVLTSYQRNPEAFWDAAMAPFLNRSPIWTLLKHSRLSIEMLRLFQDVHKHAFQKLDQFSDEDGLKITTWKSLKSKEEYFTDAYPIYAFLAIWMKENAMDDVLARFDEILDAIVLGIAGYGILDVLVDGTDFSAVELLEAQRCISEYETRILQVFGVTSTNLKILHTIRDPYLKAEIKEKSLRYKSSPYTLDQPIACGYKAAHLLTPFMLSLERIGRAYQIDDYFQVFFLFGAVIQMIDDLKDLEDDLKIGHYAYVTLGTSTIKDIQSGVTIEEAAQNIRNNKEHVTKILVICRDLIDQSVDLLNELKDPFLMRIVEITRLRMESYFSKLDVSA